MLTSGGTLYAIRAEGTSLVKIGYTRGSVEKRVQRLQTGQPFSLQIVATLPVKSDARHKESLLHAFLAKERRRGEWFELALQSEDFAALLARAIAFGRTIEQGEREPGRTRPIYRLDDFQVFGTNIQRAREQRGWSQSTLAQRAGLPTRTVQRIEHASIQPQPKTLHRLAQALNLSLPYLSGSTKKRTHYCTEALPTIFRTPCPYCARRLTDDPTPPRRTRARKDDPSG